MSDDSQNSKVEEIKYRGFRCKSLKYYLEKMYDEKRKATILKKLAIIFSFPSVSSNEQADYFRYLGQQVLRIQLIEEVNKDIMEYMSDRRYLALYVAELLSLKRNCEDLLGITTKLLRALLAQGNATGMYTPEASTTTDGD